IGTLNDDEMRKAVGIIRNGCPHLRVSSSAHGRCRCARGDRDRLLTVNQDVNDDELELDIDQIPENVLSDLLKYIRGQRPKPRRTSNAGAANHAHHGGLHDDEYEPGSRTKGAASTNPRKKNKPMSKA